MKCINPRPKFRVDLVNVCYTVTRVNLWEVCSHKIKHFTLCLTSYVLRRTVLQILNPGNFFRNLF